MKIVIVQGAFLPVPPLLGGAVEKIWFRLGQEFAAQGHEVWHLSRQHPDLPEREKIHGVHHLRVRGYATPASMWRLKLCDLLYSLRGWRRIPADADVIVTNTFWLPILLRGRLASRVHVDVQRMPKGQMRLYRHTGCLRANSTPVAEAIAREWPTGARHPRITTIPNPLPFDPVSPDLSTKRPVVLYAGRIHPEKGLHVLLEAWRRLGAPEWMLRIVGPWEVEKGGGGTEYLDSLQKSAPGNVEFVGLVSDPAQLNAIYAEAAIFVYPSLAEAGETFGLAPLEAMAWGAVPVVSALACFADFIRNGENGVVFNHRVPDPAGNLSAALGRLLEAPETRARMAVAAAEVNETHSPARIAAEFLADFALLRSHASP